MKEKEIELKLHEHKIELMRIIEDRTNSDISNYSRCLMMKMCSDYDYLLEQI